MLSVDDLNLYNLKSNIMLINKYGQVIYNEIEHQQSNNSQIYYIYNESITGFNNSDWKIIEDQAISNTKTEFENEDQLSKCIILYNKFFKSNVQQKSYYTLFIHLRSEKFMNENFTLIIYTNVTSKNILVENFQEAYLESEIWILSGACSILLMGALSFSISIDVKNIFIVDDLILNSRTIYVLQISFVNH